MNRGVGGLSHPDAPFHFQEVFREEDGSVRNLYSDVWKWNRTEEWESLIHIRTLELSFFAILGRIF